MLMDTSSRYVGFDRVHREYVVEALGMVLWSDRVMRIAADIEYARRRERYPLEEWGGLRECLVDMFGGWFPGIVMDLVREPGYLPLVSTDWLFNQLLIRGEAQAARWLSDGESLLLIRVVTQVLYEDGKGAGSYPRVELA
jgi:hypothetical protein